MTDLFQTDPLNFRNRALGGESLVVMKTPLRLLLLGLCAGSFLCLQTVRADDNPPPGGPPGKMHAPHLPPGFDQLNLTDAQKAAIMQILKDTEAERRQKIDQVLTAEQNAQLDKMKEEHHGHGGDEGNMPPPPPGN